MALTRRRTHSELPEQNDIVVKQNASTKFVRKKDRGIYTDSSDVNGSDVPCEKSLSIEDKQDILHSKDRMSSIENKRRAIGIKPSQKKVLADIKYYEVEDAIWASDGQITSVAKHLRISVFHVKDIFKRYKMLNQEFIEFREMVTDEVENALLNQIRNGNVTATIFYLKCHGKERGFIERAEIRQNKRGIRMKINRASEVVNRRDGKKSSVEKKAENILAFRKAVEESQR